MDGWMHGGVDPWMDGWMKAWMKVWIHGWMDRRMVLPRDHPAGTMGAAGGLWAPLGFVCFLKGAWEGPGLPQEADGEVSRSSIRLFSMCSSAGEGAVTWILGQGPGIPS